MDLGIPIQILDGVGNADTKTSMYVKYAENMEQDLKENPQYHGAIIDLLLSKDVDSALNGDGILGATESQQADKAIYDYLVKTKNLIIANPDSVAQYQNPIQLVEMLDYAIKYWNTPQRDKALEILADKESDLIENGYIHINYLQGLDGADDEWYDDIEYDPEYETTERGLDYRYVEVEGINGTETGRQYRINGLGGFFRKIKKGIHKIASKAKQAAHKVYDVHKKIIKKVVDVHKKVAKAAWKGIKKFNPLSVTVRNAFLLGLRLNLFHLGDGLAIGYMSAAEAAKRGVSQSEHAKMVNVLKKVQKLHTKILGGKLDSLKKAVLSGHRKDIARLSGLGDVSFNGYLGEPITITGATAAAASFFAKVGSWFKKSGIKLKDIANKVFKGKHDGAKKHKFFAKVKDKFVSFKNKFKKQGKESDIPYTTDIPTIENRSSSGYTPKKTDSKGNNTKPKFGSKDWFKKNKKPLLIGTGIFVLATVGGGVAIHESKKKKKKSTKSQSKNKDKAPKSLEGVKKVKLN